MTPRKPLPGWALPAITLGAILVVRFNGRGDLGPVMIWAPIGGMLALLLFLWWTTRGGPE